MGIKFDVRNFAIITILGLAVVTILSVFLSQFFPDSVSTLKTGKAFIILAIAFYVVMIFLFSYDKRLENRELFSLIFVALAFAAGLYFLNKFVPEIFSALPEQSKQIFSALGN